MLKTVTELPEDPERRWSKSSLLTESDGKQMSQKPFVWHIVKEYENRSQAQRASSHLNRKYAEKWPQFPGKFEFEWRFEKVYGRFIPDEPSEEETEAAPPPRKKKKKRRASSP